MLCHTYNTALSNLIYQMLVAGVAYIMDYDCFAILLVGFCFSFFFT